MSDSTNRDEDGQATAVNIVTQIKPFGLTWYRLLFFVARNVGYITAPIRKQQFIHFCRWSVLTTIRMPDGSLKRLKHPMLWFESNYDGDVVRYMDTFARIIPWRMRAAWTPTERFPDMFPPEPFHQWTIDNSYESSHYWSAYPEATTRDVGRALRVRRAADALAPDLESVAPDDFLRRWRVFLADVQGDL